MQINMTKVQKKILSVLLDKYENSKSYTNENKVHQSFTIKPNEIMPDYYSDFADVDELSQFDDEIIELENQRLVDIRRNKQGIIKTIVAVDDSWDIYYSILNRQDKSTIIEQQVNYFKSLKTDFQILQKFIDEQLHRLENGKKTTYSFEDTKILIKLCERILGNKTDILERELSITVLGDSKTFEKTYKSKVCSILKKYGDYESILDGIDEKTEMKHIILEEHRIYSNPSYVYIKGSAVIKFVDGSELKLFPDISIGLSSNSIEHIKSISINSDIVMTIENLTSFNRMQDENAFYIYLEGYHNTIKTKFLKLIAAKNNKSWLHFGDIDPDGFYILEHLKRSTGINFTPYRMNVDEMKEYFDYVKVLEQNDIVKANNLLTNNVYAPIMTFMLDNNCKLEQEVISLDLMKLK